MASGSRKRSARVYRAPERDEVDRRLERFLGAADGTQLPVFGAFADAVQPGR